MKSSRAVWVNVIIPCFAEVNEELEPQPLCLGVCSLVRVNWGKTDSEK